MVFNLFGLAIHESFVIIFLPYIPKFINLIFILKRRLMASSDPKMGHGPLVEDHCYSVNTLIFYTNY